MVNFSVFNELSLPLKDIKEFEYFFEVLSELKSLGLDKIRMDQKFTQYPEILPSIPFQQLLGQIDRDKAIRLKSFIKNGITIIESPLILKDEQENEQLLENEYIYNNNSIIGALACCDIWNTITISFYSSEEWNKEKIILKKQTILDEKEIDIEIRHSSTIEHLSIHQDFFTELDEDKKLGITQNNFWIQREKSFPNKIIFCKEIEKQIKDIDKSVFEQAISILRDIESDKKKIRDYNYSGESQSVKDDEKLKKLRCFTINDNKVYFDKHIKSLPNANRIYFLEQDDKIYIGYIGKHLPTKKFS